MAEMMRLSAEDVLKRHDKALTKKEDFRSLYEECYEFALVLQHLYEMFELDCISIEMVLHILFRNMLLQMQQSAFLLRIIAVSA